MKTTTLQVIAHDKIGCKDGNCPTIYKSDDGRFYVQGYRVSQKVRTSINVPKNEMLIEVSQSLLQNMISNGKVLL